MAWMRRFGGALLRDGVLTGHLHPPGGLLGRCLVALITVAFGAAAGLALDPWLLGAQLMIFLPSIGLTALLCGPAPGLFAAGLSFAAAIWRAGGSVAASDHYWLPLFAVVAAMNVGLISALLETVRRSRLSLGRIETLNASLQQSEARFRDLVEDAPDAIVIADADERIVLVNAAAERLFAYPREELVGRPVDMLMPERFRTPHQGRIGRFAGRGGVRRMGNGDELTALRKDGVEIPIETNLSRLPGSPSGQVCSVVRDLRARREHMEHQSLLIRELNHRVKNTLASVQSIVGQTLRSAGDPRAFSEALTARIMALSQSHDVLTRNDWAGALIRDIVAEQLSPYEHGAEAPLRLSGPDVRLTPNRAVALGMVIGELCTNAAKFGALSAGGTVEVVWKVAETPGAPRLTLTWTERGGPAVKPPTRRGFGARMIERSLSSGLHGSATLTYQPEGVVCVLEFPLAPGEAARAH